VAHHFPHVTLHGKPLTLKGKPIQIGDRLPGGKLLTPEVQPFDLSHLRGVWCIVSTVPSLDTPVCSKQAKDVENHAASSGALLRWVVISEDLPFAQKKWMGESHCTHVKALSDAHSHSFAHATGLWVDELGVLARAVLLVDPEGMVREVIVCPELSAAPDYRKILDTLQHLQKTHQA
jgi:thiol peroxidase